MTGASPGKHLLSTTPPRGIGRCFRLKKKDKVTSTMLRMFYHNGQFFLQIDTFSLLRGAYFFQALLRGGLFNLAKRITCSKNTVV